MPEEGTKFVVDTNAAILGGSVPVLNITNDGAIFLTSIGGTQLRGFEVRDNGTTYVPLTSPLRGPDGDSSIYLTAGHAFLVKN